MGLSGGELRRRRTSVLPLASHLLPSDCTLIHPWNRTRSEVQLWRLFDRNHFFFVLWKGCCIKKSCNNPVSVLTTDPSISTHVVTCQTSSPFLHHLLIPFAAEHTLKVRWRMSLQYSICTQVLFHSARKKNSWWQWRAGRLKIDNSQKQAFLHSR